MFKKSTTTHKKIYSVKEVNTYEQIPTESKQNKLKFCLRDIKNNINNLNDENKNHFIKYAQNDLKGILETNNIHRILSQEEVDILFEYLSSDKKVKEMIAKLKIPKNNKKVKIGEFVAIQKYDLTNQDRIIRGRMPILEILYEYTIKEFRTRLSKKINQVSTVSIISTDLLKFGEFVNTLPIPSYMSILKTSLSDIPIIVVWESKLAYSLIDSVLGGNDRPFGKIQGKEFTSLELSILNNIEQEFNDSIKQGFSRVFKKFTLEKKRTEINPQFIGIVPPSDVVICTTFEVEFNSVSGSILVCIPYSAIEKHKLTLSSSFQTDRNTNDGLISLNPNLSKKLKYEIELRSKEVNSTIEKVKNLKVGDIIELTESKEDKLRIFSNQKEISIKKEK